MSSPDSVLISLRRLRQIEDQRVEREEQEARQRTEAQRQAAEAAVLARREAEERDQREVAEAAERERQRQAEQAREERLRLAEAQARARVEAELQLERERLGRELEARRGLRRSGLERALPIALCLLLALGIALTLLAWRRESANASELASRLEAARQREAEVRGRERGLEGTLAVKASRIDELGRQLALCLAIPTPAGSARPAPPTRPHPPRPGRPPRPPTTIDTSCAKDPIGCIAPGR